jgi:hypothetical protein
MAYTDVHSITVAPRAGGDLRGRIEMAFVHRANVRINAIEDAEDQREVPMIRTVIDGQVPSSWVTLALTLLDDEGFLTAPTDAQIDAEVLTAWNRITKSRG